MEKSIRKSATIVGIFASVAIAGYTATLYSRKPDYYFSTFQKRIRDFKIPEIPKIAPTIPDLDKVTLSSGASGVEIHPGDYE